jgi:hypothetical protein
VLQRTFGTLCTPYHGNIRDRDRSFDHFVQ